MGGWNIRGFNPTGPTVKIACSTSAATGVQVLSSGAPPAEQYRVQNNGSQTIFYSFGTDASAANSNAVIPTGSGANSKNSYPLPAGAIEVISAGRDYFFSGITAASTSDLYVTPGKGL